MNRLHILAAALYGKPWAMHPPALKALDALLRSALARRSAPADSALPPAAGPLRQGQQSGGVAVIPIVGGLMQRGWSGMELWGMGAYDLIAQTFRAAMADPGIRSIVLEVDSPGGEVFGLEELAAEVLAARGQKKVVAVANSMAASAAYYIASQAAEVVVAPGGMVGSIGCWTMHMDWSRSLDNAGVTPTLIRAGKFKVESNPFEPLGEEALAHEQSIVDHYYGMFLAAVARGRGVKPTQVRGGMGEGRMVTAAEAVKLGMADRVATMDQVLARLGAAPRGAIAPLGQDDPIPAQAQDEPEAAPAQDDDNPPPATPAEEQQEQSKDENAATVRQARLRLNRLALGQ